VDLFVSLITTVGFPITCVIVLGLFIWYIYKRSEQREQELRAEISKSQEINNKFADIISKYSVEITEIKTDIKDIKEDIIILTEHIPQ
jgi:hypothetical protein